MLARVWVGVTLAAKADQYFEYLKATGLKDYLATEGNRGVWVLRHVQEERAEFTLISLWESWESIRRFAGEEVDRAVYYPEDRDYLLALDPKVTHHEVLVAPGIGQFEM